MLEVKNVSFLYDNESILENVNLKLNTGRIYGLIGPNGSGKTTLLNCLSSYYYPSSGEILFNNNSIENELEYLKDIVLLTDDYYIGMYNITSLAKKLSFLYNKSIDNQVLNYLLEKFKLSKTKNIRYLSKGNRRIAILSVILALKPKYLFMDEFLDGVDIVNRKHIKDYLLEYIIDNDATIILASHTLDDIKDICSDLILIKDKTIKVQDDIDEFKGKYVTYQVVSDNIIDELFFKDNDIEIKQFKNLGNIYWISVERTIELDVLLHDYEIKDIRIIKASIDEVVYYEFIS